MGQKPKNIVILGGGITGLSAAFYVQRFFREHNLPITITLIEQSAGLGGKISTLHKAGFVIEKGPDSFLARKLPMIELTQELGLEDQLVATNPQAKKTYILHQGQLHRMPAGLMLGIPTQFMPLIKTGLLSLKGKARAGLDLLIPKRKENMDESLGGFLERRLGREVVEHIAEPLLAGIYAGDTYKLSLQATFPQFQSAERNYGSLIKGMLANKKNAPKSAETIAVAKNSMFLSYRNGLSTIIDGLISALAGTSLITNQTATSVQAIDQGYEISLASGQRIAADAVIVALPAFAAAKLLPQISQVKALSEIPYVSVANVILAFDHKDIGHELDGSGFLVPRREGRFITACTWTSAKWKHTAPNEKVLLRCYVGRSGDEGWIALSDDEIVKRVRNDLQQILGIVEEPAFYEVTRLLNSMPQYPVGHLQTIKAARNQLNAVMPHVFLAGAAYQGVGLPDCIRQGKEAAQQVVNSLAASYV
ncbi:protoporphyrinogen oxidase [Paenibacillus psychroresistens]|uniref:Coproporphyrinogen III oxidase n=1 Tax=Paenibacillus psychroresistens TaxID=1778678 RepID=A0A6B8RH03_9BACL|nr:protoporphyrinogen oxidase [Paenibacillus psychroresistens]QGQ95379.1 protoporphyrinogen oxidase [Paenibacillus psychroresistens]